MALATSSPAATGWRTMEETMSAYQPVDPFLRLTVGVPIYTDDGQKIGTVKEIRGRSFKVQTGLLQRDYWLSADCLDSATAGEPAILRVAKDELDRFKEDEAPEAAA